MKCDGQNGAEGLLRGMLSRRRFLAGVGVTLAAPQILLGKDQVPRMLDHILLGVRDLDAGIAFVEQKTGLRAAIGGVHPGRGTRNALLSLGERCYLEIIARDPEQAGTPDPYGLAKLDEPRLVTWAAHPGNIEEFARKLQEAGIAFDGPSPGSRKRPDGRVLEWKTVVLKENRGGLLPFFIEWSAGSLHPSVDAPQGCRLERFEAAAPDRDGLARTFKKLSLDVATVRGERTELGATIAGPGGEFAVTSFSSLQAAPEIKPASSPLAEGIIYVPGQAGIKAPECVYCPAPSYSEEARNKHLQGKVVLELIVLPNGRVTSVRVVRGVGMGLDEKAVEAVRKWRFKPMIGPQGQPVAVEFDVQVAFRLGP